MNAIQENAATWAATPGICSSYSLSVPAIGTGGGPVPVYVTTQPGCAWQISHAGSFLSYYGSRTGSGSGVAYLYATADRGATRTAPVYVLQAYSYPCGLGGRSMQLCSGYTTATGITMVQY